MVGNGGDNGIFFGAPIYWHSRKLPRVAPSSFDAENQAMREGADATIHCRIILSYMGLALWEGPGFKKGTRMVTDHDGVIRHLRGIKGTRAKGYPELDILALRSLRDKGEVSLGWTSTQSNAADGLTKLVYPNPLLRHILRTGKAQFCPPGTSFDQQLEDNVQAEQVLNSFAVLPPVSAVWSSGSV
jgi:hypothetical protein